jgi:hypothetical protein
MVEQNKQASSGGRISPDDRFHYIGFDVFPGKGGDIFKSDSEKANLVEAVLKKRSKGEMLREQCSLLLQRVSGIERTVLAVASAIILLSLFMPWYSAFNETVVQPTQTAAVAADQGGVAGEELITGAQTGRRTRREPPVSLSGIGSLIAIGSVGGAMFSSGFALILTALVMLVYTLLAIALPVYVLMALFKKTKESADETALRLKKLLRLGWYPVILFAAALLLSFMGADYGSGVAAAFTSFGASYGPGVFLGSLSWGMFVALGGFLLLATKGIEI